MARGLVSQSGGLVGRLPGKVGIFAAKVTIGSGLLIDGTPQFERFDDPLGGQLKVLAHQLFQAIFRNFAGVEGIHQYADRFGHADGVGELDFTAIGEPRGNDILGDIAAHVAGRAVNLGRVFAAESSAAVPAHASVGIDDDLAARQARVAHGTAHHKPPRGIDVVFGIGIEQFGGNGGLDHVLKNVGVQGFVVDGLRVLGGNDHRIDAFWLIVGIVFHRDLRFSVGPQIRQLAALAHFGKTHRQFVGQRDGGGHEIVVLVACIPEHHALVARAARIHAHRDIGRLGVNGRNHGAGV